MQSSYRWLRQLLAYNIPRLHSVTSSPQPVTAASLAAFLGVCAWGWLLLIAFTGWGRWVSKLLRLPQLPAAVACTLGIGVAVFLGGILNLFHAVYLWLLITSIALGVALFFLNRGQPPVEYRWREFWRQASPLCRTLLIAAILIFLARAVGTVGTGEFYIADDSAAYLVFPQKMLAHHTFAPDPFSERRLTSDLGAPYLLEDLVISATSLPHIAVADRGLGLLLLAAILFELGVAFKLSVLHIALLDILASLVPQETFNLTFVVLPVPLFLGMLWMIWKAIEEKSRYGRLYSLMAGVIGGAIISLKSTYLPEVCALLLVPYLLVLGRKHLKITVQLFAIAATGSLVTIAAWMIAMKINSGTYLFPLLGRGLDYSRLHLFHSATKVFTERSVGKVFLQGLVLLILAAVQVFTGREKKQARFGASVVFSSALAMIALNYTTGSDSIWRYNFPQFFTAIIVFYVAAASLLSQFPFSRRFRVAFVAGIVGLLGMVSYYDISGSSHRLFRQVRWEFPQYQASLLAGLSGRPLASPYLHSRYREIEKHIPEQGISLENVAYPFLFNYNERKIFIMDWPGAAAPLPGWPFGKASSVVARYLRHNSVRYVIFDRGYSLHLDATACQVLKKPSLYSEWLLQQVWLNTLADLQLNDLAAHYHSSYDDGKIVVIDLDSPALNYSAEESNWAIDAKVDAVCSDIAQRYMSTRAGRSSTVADVE